MFKTQKLSFCLGGKNGCPNFTHWPSLPLSLIPLDHRPQSAVVDDGRARADACVDDGGNFASSSICSTFHPPQSDSAWNAEGNPKSPNIADCQFGTLARWPSWKIKFLTFFGGISHDRFESRDSFPHYIRCPERGNSFSPFLRRGRRRRRRGASEGGGRGPSHRGRDGICVPSTILGLGFQKSLPFFCSSLTMTFSWMTVWTVVSPNFF